MNVPDIINGTYELAGSLAVWANVFAVHKDKGYAGIRVSVMVFFTSWGLWNLYLLSTPGSMVVSVRRSEYSGFERGFCYFNDCLREKEMSVGFTGTKMGMTEPQHWAVSNLLWIFGSTKPREFHHGDCEGADVQAARIANWYHYRIVCHPPINNKHRGWYKFNDITKPAHDYIIRDQEIVDDSQVLIATPHTPYEVVRSGTWTTVRYARQQNLPIYIVKPDGTVEKENI